MSAGFVRGLGPRGFHRMAYLDHGVAGDPVPVVCVHGLTRNGRDFDRLAAALASTRRVVCPDVVGRGGSDWLADPAGYSYPQYLADMNALLARLGAEQVDWVGTSMGGLIGLQLAAAPGTPIRRLVLNDVGPFIPKAALERIGTYVGTDPRFADLGAAETYLRRIHAGFALADDAAWRDLTRHSVCPAADSAENGAWRLAYDPGIAAAFRAGPLADVDLWAVWDQVRVPVLVLRGGKSDLLTTETAAEMTRRGPRAQVVEIPEAGHAPGLTSEAEIGIVSGFLLG